MAAGSRKATEVVYRLNYKTVISWIVTQGGQAADAEDVYQEAMVVLFKKSQQPDFRLTCKISTFLFAVSKHLWFKRLDHLRRQPATLGDNAGNDEGLDWIYEDEVRTHLEQEAHFSRLEHAIDQLGDPCSSLLRAFYHKGLSMSEIASQFGYTNPDNAKTQKYKCLNRLKKIFHGNMGTKLSKNTL